MDLFRLSWHNILFVGGSVDPGGGMPMVCLWGQLVADRVLGQWDE